MMNVSFFMICVLQVLWNVAYTSIYLAVYRIVSITASDPRHKF
jgi:hypothetical protein